MGNPAKYQVVPYLQIFRRHAYISHLPKCLTHPTEATPTDFTKLTGIIHAAVQIQYHGIHHVIFPIHLLAPSLCPSHDQTAFFKHPQFTTTQERHPGISEGPN